MQIVLKELYRDGWDWELDKELPFRDGVNWVEVYLGPKDKEDSDSFDLTICSVEYVQKQIEEHQYFSGLWHLVTGTPTYEVIKGYIEGELDKLAKEGYKTWDEYLVKLRMIGYWEFEDYLS